MASHGELMDARSPETGLDDFGDDAFREGLEILVRALGDEARLNAAGEGYLYPRITGYLAQRLQVEDWYRRHPEIGDERVDAPLIGLGLPRTGSTALSFLLAQDPDDPVPAHVGVGQPCPPPSTVEGADPRVPQGWGSEEAGPDDHVPSDIEGPFECLDLLALDFKSQMFLAFAQIPSYADWLLERRPRLGLRVRAARPEAPAVGPADATVAAEVADAHAVPADTSTRCSPTPGSW